MTTELRRAVRYPIVASVEVRQRQTHVKVRASTSDLSVAGCYVDTLNPLPCGTELELQITHNDEAVTIRGTVAYARANMGMGVQFEVMEEEQLTILRRWIAATLPPP